MVTLPLPQANQFYTPNSKCGTLLPEFPTLVNLQLKAPFPIDKVRYCHDNHECTSAVACPYNYGSAIFSTAVSF